MSLTEKQFQILEFIQQYRDARGISPTMGEIAIVLGVTKVTVHEHLRQLERKGAIRREKFRARSIIPLTRVDERGSRLQLAVRGSIRCARGDATSSLKRGTTGGVSRDQRPGNGHEAVVDLLRLFPSASRCFVLRVDGDGLEASLICDGDFVVVAENVDPTPGALVVQMGLGGAATLRRYRSPARRTRAADSSRASAPPPLAGVVIGVLRAFESRTSLPSREA